MYVVERACLVVLLAASAALGASCDFGWCTSGDDPPPVEELFMLDLAVGAEDAGTRLQRVLVLQDRINAPVVSQRLIDRAVHVSRDGNQVLFGNQWFQIDAPADETLPDSLSSCVFTHGEARLLCVVTAPDAILNASAGREQMVAAARTRLEFRASIDGPAEVVLADTARFFEPDKYRVTTFARPVLSRDDRKIVFVRNRETHKVVLDATGAVVNDVIFAADAELVYLDLDDPANPLLLAHALTDVARNQPWIALSPDGAHVAFEQGRAVYLTGVSATASRLVMDGKYPQFSGTGAVLMVQSEATPYYGDLTMTLYDVDAGTSTVVTDPDGIRYPTLQPETDRVYYVAGGAVKYYDLHRKQHAQVFTLDRYFKQREASESLAISGGLYQLVVLPGQPNRILAFGTLSYFFVDKGGC